MRKRLNYLWIIPLTVAVILIIYNWSLLKSMVSFHHLKAFILSWGRLSEVVFVLLYGLKPIVFIIPASMLSILAGSIYGPVKAFVLSIIGCTISATLAFYLARVMGKSFVEKHLKGKALKLDDTIETQGFKIIFIMRLSVIFHYDGLSYAAGLTKMKYRDFILGTLLGITPEMIAYTSMGKHIHRLRSPYALVPIISAILLAVLAYFIYKRKDKSAT